MFCNDEEENWILDYLASGKGIILYQMVTNLDSLKIVPKNGDFFEKQDFYSTLKEKRISDHEYEDVKVEVDVKVGECEVERFSSKIIKMDENNQYGFAMTKPLPYGCIKLKKTIPTLDELKDLLAKVSLDDKIGHLFIADIVFDDINEKTILFNELYPPIFEKK